MQKQDKQSTTHQIIVVKRWNALQQIIG